MVVLTLALILVAVTAALIIRDVQAPEPKHRFTPHDERSSEEPPAEPVDLPTQAVDMTGLLADEHDPPTADQDLSVLQTAAATVEPSVIPVPPEAVPVSESDHLIQTEVLQRYGEREQALALSKLLIGIAGSGIGIGLVIIALARGIEALVRALTG